jgi:quercetin dioxygenase-like cupin family protein
MMSDAVEQADELAAILKRTETLRRSSSIPGREIVQVRTEIPAGVQSGWHTHPGEEVGYIVAGTVRMEIFVTTETLPIGLLPQIAGDLHVARS